MAIVEHEIPARSGKFYLYEHFRGEDGKVHCKYLGVAENVKVVDSIPQKGFPVEAKKYEEGHKAGIEAEKKEYGDKRAKEFNEHIEKVIPEDELAGSHTKSGKILIHKKIDPEYKGQLITHEAKEHEVMTGERIIKDEPEGSKEICRQLKGNPQKDEVSAHSKKDGGHEHDRENPEGLYDHPQYEHTIGGKGREHLTSKQQDKVAVVMREYEKGKLYSSSGEKVTDRKQALAIAHSEARKI